MTGRFQFPGNLTWRVVMLVPEGRHAHEYFTQILASKIPDRLVPFLISGRPSIVKPDDKDAETAGGEIAGHPIEIIDATFNDRETDEIGPFPGQKVHGITHVQSLRRRGNRLLFFLEQPFQRGKRPHREKHL
jgi:hypothetical protein